ncbi:hypothetical protein QP572_03560 [Brevibacterium sp. UMB10442]|nr:hypothetical protein [Brevibacterium sp. UMB10442]
MNRRQFRIALALGLCVGVALALVVPLVVITPRVAVNNAIEDLMSGKVTHEWANRSPGDSLESAGLVEGLGVTPRIQFDSTRRDGDVAHAQLLWTWDFAQPITPWKYHTRITVKRVGLKWKPVAEDSLVAPGLNLGDRVRVRSLVAARGAIRGAGGVALMQEARVVNVGIEPRRVTDVKKLASELRSILDLELKALEKRVESAPEDQYLHVSALRQEDYNRLEKTLRPIPGVVFRKGRQPITVEANFATETLGTVGPATAEDIEKLTGTREGDTVGKSGIQRAYNSKLSGTRGFAVERIPADAGEFDPPHELATIQSEPGSDVSTTLDVRTQNVAQDVLSSSGSPASLVVIRPSDGHVLAVANHDPASAVPNRALYGQYAPAATFTCVTEYALAKDGVLDSHTLADSAKALGFTSSLHGLDVAEGQVPLIDSPAARQQASRGQGEVLASPLNMATVAASIAAGHTVSPVLVAEDAPNEPATPLDSQAVKDVRNTMREAFTDDTASQWFTGYDGDLAISVFVEDRNATSAVPIAKDFFAQMAK